MAEKFLTKSRYLQGLQCPKLLWLSLNEPELDQGSDEATQHLYTIGKRVGAIAQKRFKKGVLISEDHFHLTQAIISTISALDQGAPTLFEATAQHERVLCRADILERIAGRKRCFDLHEVKMSTEFKDVHIPDLAIQRYCFERAGYPVRSTWLMHVNKTYIREGVIDPLLFLAEEDCTNAVGLVMDDTEKNIKELCKVMSAKKCPSIEVGKQCLKPYPCPFFDSCNKPHPLYSIHELPYGKKVISLLQEKGIEFLKNIPQSIKLSHRQEQMVQSVKAKKPVINKKAIQEYLGTLVHPLYYFDFETINPAIPPFDNWRSYQTTPFQFSLHIQKKRGGSCEHHEFLLKEAVDPRVPLIKSMIKLLGTKGSIVAWNMSFETGVIKEMAKMFPEYRDRLLALVPRFWDLIVPFRTGDYAHYNFHGSASIKDVLPVLVPSLSYQDLSIQEGGTASLKYERWLTGDMEKKEWESTYKNLLEYCKLDTWAMVEIMRVLEEVV